MLEAYVDYVMKPSQRDCFRGVSLRESCFRMGCSVLFATGVGSPPARIDRASYDGGSPLGSQTID